MGSGAFAIILDDERRVLLCHRRDIDAWNLPGGRVEEGEAPWDAAIRETREEVGLEVEVARLTGLYWRPERTEVVFAFEFPERPGALLQFLSTLGSRWNISLFHYRNHGSAFGRVLCGFEAAPGERDELLALLRTLGFDRSEESGDPAVELFLK